MFVSEGNRRNVSTLDASFYRETGEFFIIPPPSFARDAGVSKRGRQE
jgi:hypothetical protein